MKTALEVNITFDQILALVKQLPKQQKVKLTRELEKEIIDSKLSQLLKAFKNEDLSLDLITEETELVRQEIYDQKKG